MALVFVLAFVGVGCGDDDSTDASAATDTSAPTNDALSDDAADPDETVDDDTVESTTSGAVAGSGSATVTHAGSQYDFLVIQCVRDVASPATNTVVTLQADGVTAGTPDGVITELLGVIDGSTDPEVALEAALEHGPLLSVTRVENGGDVVAIITGSESFVTAAAPSGPERFLDIDGGTVTGTGPTDAGPMSVDLTCP
ncbi:hypothetical protein NHL50_15765 [Acidimicrobiia bacterium EGI L10123]|uniref:hypothetical protein n=1 Tax=Salinilacustrithrix flava TaxID=2957203 RepID=UPI003D7C26E9|nr:hypothetical protein [Acidimicrobiia bacterium EGI L10123]